MEGRLRGGCCRRWLMLFRFYRFRQAPTPSAAKARLPALYAQLSLGQPHRLARLACPFRVQAGHYGAPHDLRDRTRAVRQQLTQQGHAAILAVASGHRDGPTTSGFPLATIAQLAFSWALSGVDGPDRPSPQASAISVAELYGATDGGTG
jgi:hypothetical protein